MTLLCWNVAGKVKRVEEQAQLVTGLGTDLVCLQEVRPTAAARWSQLLEAAGWPHVAIAPVDVAADQRRQRPLSVLTAARTSFTIAPVPDLPWPERVLCTVIDGLTLLNVHSPISPSPAMAKVLTHEAVHAYAEKASGARAICGDLNTPRREHPDGRVWTFARTRNGNLRPDRGERWDRAELALIKGLEPHGFRDAFRTAHGLDVRELSWQWQQWGGGYRLDHLIVSEDVTVDQILYLHDWRRIGLSDHSPLFARVRWGSG